MADGNQVPVGIQARRGAPTRREIGVEFARIPMCGGDTDDFGA